MGFPQPLDTRESPLDMGRLVFGRRELLVVSQRWIPFPTALLLLVGLEDSP